MKIDMYKELLNEFRENVNFNYDLKKKNWFNIGGKTKIFYKAENLKNLVSFLKKLNNKERIFILGAGSNTLISDEIYDGLDFSGNFVSLASRSQDVPVITLNGEV